MSHGFQVVGAAGNIQIDEDYANFEVVSKGIVTGGGRTYYSGANDGSNLVFVRPESHGVKVGQWGPYAGGQNGSGIWEPGTYFLLNTQAPAGKSSNVSYFTATPSSYYSTAGGGYGLRVFRPDGKVAFDSNKNYLKIAGVVMAKLNVPYHTINLPSLTGGKRYYVLLNQLWITEVETYCYSSDDCEDTNYGLMAEFISDTQIRIYTRAWLNDEAFGSSSTKMSAEHTPCVLIAIM